MDRVFDFHRKILSEAKNRKKRDIDEELSVLLESMRKENKMLSKMLSSFKKLEEKMAESEESSDTKSNTPKLKN